MKRLLLFVFCILPLIVAAQLARRPTARSMTRSANWPPTVVITSPTLGQTFQQGDNISFTATATGQSGTVTNLEWFIDGAFYQTQTPPYLVVLTNALAGEYAAIASAIDNRGSFGQAVRFFTVVAPANIPPTITFDSPTNGTKVLVGTPVTVVGTPGDLDGTIRKVELRNGSRLAAIKTNAPWTFTWDTATRGSYPLTLVAEDNQGARATSAPPVFVFKTNSILVPATVVILTPTNNQSFTQPVDITFTATAVEGNGTVTNVTYTAGPFTGSATTAPWTAVWTNALIGSWNAVATATDTDGLVTSSAFRPFAVSAPANALPTITLDSPATGTKELVGNAITIDGTALDSDGSIALVEFRAGLTLLSTDLAFPYTYNWIGPPGTNFPLTLVAQDNQGARVTSAPPVLVSFTNNPPVITNQAPTISITSPANGQQFTTPGNFTLNFAVADSDGTVASVQVLTNGVLSQTLTGAPWQISYTNLTPGVWTFQGRVFDNLGTNTLSSVVSVTIVTFPNNAPFVSIDSPTTGASFTAPAGFTVIVSATDSDGTIARVDLLVNNVVTTNLTVAPYNFAITGLAAGSYAYRARAYDNLGTNTTSAQVVVTVTAPPAPPPDPPTTFTAIGGNGQVTLNWSSVVGASSYTLSFGTVPDTYFTLTNLTGLSFSHTSLTNGTTYYYQISSVNAQGAGTPSASISVTPIGPTQATSIVRGSTWKFFDADSNLGAGSSWGAVAFDDSAWLSGPAPLGYGDTAIATQVSLGRQAVTNTTTYFRQHFTVTNASSYTNITLNAVIDDGAVFFLNGTEVLRRGVPAGENYHTLASAHIGTERIWSGTNYVNPALLVAGDNVLAVRLHSRWNSLSPPDADADLFLDVEMYSSLTNAPTPPTAPSQLQATAGNSGTIPGGQAQGTEYFASPTGNAGNTGLTVASPWTLAKALTDAGEGNTITLLNGTYPSFRIIKNRQLVRAQNRLGAKVTGDSGSAFGAGIYIRSTAGGPLTNVVIDGLEVNHSWVDGIAFIAGSDNCVIRNSWVHHSGWGDPAAVTNSTGAYRGQGISPHNCDGTLIENCLIEDNGLHMTPGGVGQDHGIYANGWNITIRGCVIRRNFGCQLVLQDEDTMGDVANAKVYNNLIVAKSQNEGATINNALAIYEFSSHTNFIFNNTVINPWKWAVEGGYIGNGILCVTNNIIFSAGGGMDPSRPGGGIRADYNMGQAALSFPGTHDVVAPVAGFVNQNNYLYWLQSSSAARGSALAQNIAFDFFKNPNKPMTDIGSFQFDPVLATDIRNLSGNLATNFWDQSLTINGSQDTIFLTWQDNSNNETGFDIDESPNGSTFSFKTSVGANITSTSISGLGSCTTRYYRARARNGADVSAYSNTANATTTCPPSPVLPAPTGLALTGGNATVAGRFNPVAGATGYTIMKGTNVSGPFSFLATISVTNFVDNAVVNNTTYFYTAATVNGAGTGPASSAASVTPRACAGAPIATGTLTATAGTAGIINLAWPNAATDETGVEIYEGSDGVNFSLINTLGANSTSYSRTGLPSAVTRHYRVRNVNSCGNSAYSNIANATTITVTNTPGFYVDVSGVASGPGDFANPWSMAWALNKNNTTLVNANPRVVYVNDGTYPGRYSTDFNASVGNPLVIQGLNSVHGPSHAVIDQNDNSVTVGSCFIYNGSRNVILRNLEIKNSAPRWSWPSTTWGNRPASVQDDTGQGNKIQGCVIHDGGNGISVQNNSSQTGFEANGNIILYCGWDLAVPDAHEEGARGYAHSFYIQNRGPDGVGVPTTPENGMVLLQDNIAGWAFSQNHQLSGSFPASRANNHSIIGNVHFMGGFSAQHNNGENGRNMLIGTEAASTNIVVSEYVGYYRPTDGLGSLILGYDGGPEYNDRICNNGKFENNYIVGRSFVKQWNGITYTGNTIVNNYADNFLQGLRDIIYTTQGTWNFNTYYTSVSALFAKPFNRNDSQISFGEWKAVTGFDGGSSVVNGLPTATFTRLRKLSYDPSKANLTILNWTLANTVNVSMAGFLSSGDTYAIYSATAPFTVHASGTYDGTSIGINCQASAQNLMAPVGGPGVLTPAKTAPLFNVFRILKL